MRRTKDDMPDELFQVIEPLEFSEQYIAQIALGLHIVPCVEISKEELLKLYPKAQP